MYFSKDSTCLVVYHLKKIEERDDSKKIEASLIWI